MTEQHEPDKAVDSASKSPFPVSATALVTTYYAWWLSWWSSGDRAFPDISNWITFSAIAATTFLFEYSLSAKRWRLLAAMLPAMLLLTLSALNFLVELFRLLADD